MSYFCSTIWRMILSSGRTSLAGQDPGERISELRAKIARITGPAHPGTTLPLGQALSPLFPSGGLAGGEIYGIPRSLGLLFAMLSAPTRSGTWSAVIGLPESNAEAAAHAGVDLSRVVFLPDPGQRLLWMATTLAEAFPLVVVAGLSASSGHTDRLRARLRERGTVLVTLDTWARQDTTLSMHDPVWEGLERGFGILRRRSVTVQAHHRRSGRIRSTRIWLPGAEGRAEPLTREEIESTAAGGQVRSAPVPDHPRWRTPA